MLHVKTEVGPSDIHGLGLIAAQDIKRGDLIWEFKAGFDLEMTREEVDGLSEAARETIMQLAYYNAERARYILCADNGRFMNHSDDPNTVSVGFQGPEGEGRTYASRDISVGEELTENYTSFETKDRNVAAGIVKPAVDGNGVQKPVTANPPTAA